MAALLADRGARHPHGIRVLARTLAAEVGVTVRTIGRWTDELERRGWLVTERTGRSSRYRLQTDLWQQVADAVAEHDRPEQAEQATEQVADLRPDHSVRSDRTFLSDPQRLYSVKNQQQQPAAEVMELLARIPERLRPEPNGAVRQAITTATRGGWTVDLLASTLNADSGRAAAPGYMVSRLRALASTAPPTSVRSPAARPWHEVLVDLTALTSPAAIPPPPRPAAPAAPSTIPADVNAALNRWRGTAYRDRMKAFTR